jgi:hypothetical protein
MVGGDEGEEEERRDCLLDASSDNVHDACLHQASSEATSSSLDTHQRKGCKRKHSGANNISSRETKSLIATVTDGLPDGWMKRLYLCPSGRHLGEVRPVLTVQHRGKRLRLRSVFSLMSSQTTDMDLGQGHCLALLAPTLDL